MQKQIFIFFGAILFMAGTSRAATSERAGDSYQLYLRALVYAAQGNLDLSQEFLKKAAELTPDNAFLMAAAAENAFRLGQYAEASKFIKKSLELDPEKSRNFVLAGQIYWAQGDTKGAEEMLKKAVDLSPDEAEPLIYLAMAVAPKDPHRAIKLYEGYLNKHPGEVELRDRVAQLYQSLGEIEKAKASWDKVLEWSPENMKAHLALAQIAEVDSDTATAISHYEAVLTQDPQNLPLLLRIGELRYRTDSMSEAHALFSKAHAIAPDSVSASFWLALLSEYRGDWTEAIRLLEQVRAKSNDPGVMLRLSYYYSQSHQQKKAVNILEELLKSDPNNADFMTYLAMAYEEGKEFKKAEKMLLKLSELKPSDPEIIFHLATLYDKMGQFEKTESMLKKALEIKPDYAMALNYLGYTYADRIMKLDEAEKMLNHAVSLSPENGAYLDSLGWLYYRRGKYKQAEDLLKQAVIQSDDPLIWDHLGQVQVANSQPQEAVISFDESLRLDPKQKKVAEKIQTIMREMPDKDKIGLFALRAGGAYRSLKTLEGLMDLKLCSQKPCYGTKVQFSYKRGEELRAEIPGPLSGPMLILVKTPGKDPEYGAIHPLFQSFEPLVKRAFSDLEEILTGDLFLGLETDALAETVQKKGSGLIAKSGTNEVTFNSDGLPKKIIWKDLGFTSMEFISFRDMGFVQMPKELKWKDGKTGFELKFKFLSPVIQLAPLPSGKNEEN